MYFAASSWFLTVSILCLTINFRSADSNSSEVLTGGQGRATGSSSPPSDSDVRQRSRERENLANFACALRRDENYRLTEALRLIIDSKGQRNRKLMPTNRQKQFQQYLRRAERDERTAAVVESLISASGAAESNVRRKAMMTSLPWVLQRQQTRYSQDAVVNRRSSTGNRYADQMAEISRELAGSNLYADEDEEDEDFYDDDDDEADDQTGSDNEEAAGGRVNSFQRPSDSSSGGTLNPLMRVISYNAPSAGGGRMLSRNMRAA